MIGPKTLDCQNCGIELYHLSAEEAQQVTNDPYRFIVFCTLCAKDETKRLEREVAE